MFEIFTLVFVAIATVVISVFLYLIFKGLQEWRKNNKLPVKTIRATVIAKNSESSYSRLSDSNSHTTTNTVRTITFQNAMDNSRHVFQVDRNIFDLTIEGDVGTLVHQGTRFHSFKHGPQSR